MGKVFNLEIDELASVDAAFRRGLEAFSLIAAPYGELVGKMRFRSFNGDVIVISSIETRLDDSSWEEVSTLKLSREIGASFLAGAIYLDPEWSDIRSVRKLTFVSADFSAECGVEVTNGVGSTLCVMAGAFPNSLAIRAPFFCGRFEPMYEPASCERTEVNG
jgi:hypothetical protein